MPDRTQDLWDVAVIGGGPAGLATALHLAGSGGLTVTLIEQVDPAGPARPKIGETIPPTCRAVLAELGVWESFRRDGHAPGRGTSACWGSDRLYYNDFFFHPWGPGWHLDRERFEATLAAEAAARGVELLRGAAVRAAEERADGWDLTVQPAGALPIRRRARMVVDATGRQAAFARRQGARKISADALVGAFVFFAADPAQKIDHGHTLIEACAEGWWYSAALPGDRRVACFMTDADLLREHGLHEAVPWHALAGRAAQTIRRLQGARPLGRPAVRPAGSCVLDHIAGSRWLAVGDAASTFDPLSSRGIFKALQSGIRAARTIQETLGGNAGATAEYERRVHREYEQYLKVRENYYAQEGRWPGHPFWARRQGLQAAA